MKFDPQSIARRLASWFSRHARELPWRSNPDPYRVWISEIMLQQTQVATVIPYFERFIARFPDVRALAAAHLDDVLAQWSGLGYYRRARMLHACSREIIATHGGEFPGDYEAILDLPGIGRYTAGAIASIAFGQPRPVLDGNVERVLARLTALRADVKSAAAQKKLWFWATEVVEAAKSPSTVNQALMELGAMVCTPQNPGCKVCPLRATCAAKHAGIQEQLPVRRKAAASKAIRYAALILCDARGRVLLTRREKSGESLLPHGLWEFPHVVWPARKVSPLRELSAIAGVSITAVSEAAPVRHAIMNYRVELVALAAKTSGRVTKTRPPQQWFKPAELASLPMASATRKLFIAR
ncbi:MAG: A/G-specific adenine glycosylase [Planctomycetes bacterium]|nr:A/G-specific adenine glycosylase [Planctomycetota bacterium]